MLAVLGLFKLRSAVKPRFAGGAPRRTPLQGHLSPTFGVMLAAGLREPHVWRWRKEHLAPRARLERATYCLGGRFAQRVKLHVRR